MGPAPRNFPAPGFFCSRIGPDGPLATVSGPLPPRGKRPRRDMEHLFDSNGQ